MPFQFPLCELVAAIAVLVVIYDLSYRQLDEAIPPDGRRNFILRNALCAALIALAAVPSPLAIAAIFMATAHVVAVLLADLSVGRRQEEDLVLAGALRDTPRHHLPTLQFMVA